MNAFVAFTGLFAVIMVAAAFAAGIAVQIAAIIADIVQIVS